MEKVYSIAIRKRINSNDRFYKLSNFDFNEIKIIMDEKYWIADPFLYEKNGITYIFYELYDLIINKGMIAYSILNDDYTASKPKIIIKGHHKSFPFIFEYNNDIYIIPESCADRNIQLYKAVDFPNIWVLEKILLDDIFAVDTIIHFKNNEVKILTSEQYNVPPPDKIVSCWVKDKLYNTSSLINEKITVDDGVLVSEGDNGIRNAGSFFVDDDTIIRPGQNCIKGNYGTGLLFFSVNCDNYYKERKMIEMNYNQFSGHINFVNGSKNIIGVHTYNSTDNYEIIDFSYLKNINYTVLFLRFLYKIVKSIYHLLKNALNLFMQFYRKSQNFYYSHILNNYKSIVDINFPWVFVAYIFTPFYHRNDDAYLNRHQNMREVLAMASTFNKLGFNAYFTDYSNIKHKLPNIDCKLIFGHNPGIIRAKEKYKDAKMILYGASTHYSYRNNIIKKMTDEFNIYFKKKAPYRRLIKPNIADQISDSILLIGSDFTLNTYPIEVRNKIVKIHQSTQECRYLKNIKANMNNNFLFMASSGTILKGALPLLKFFKKFQKYNLYWVGRVDKELDDIMSNIPQNIHYFGYMDISSTSFLDICSYCDFMIYPSGVEGVPGSVLNCMKNGLIPIVSPCCAIEGIEDIGFIMKDFTDKSIKSGVEWATKLTNIEIVDMKYKCQNFVLDNYNIEKFSDEFEKYIKKILI